MNCITDNPPAPIQDTFFRVSWWNGGGKVRTRLCSNPELRKFLSKKPDIFVYGEAETSSPLDLNIDGYVCHLHESRLNLAGNLRRGLAIFYLKKYQYRFTKIYASRNYDIIWMRLKTSGEILHFCFFYAPGSHHPLPIRSKFYDHFSSELTKFAALGKVYLMGDTNARLGSFLDDKNVHGELISNPNKSLFLEFLEYSGLIVMNNKYCRGVATYEIIGKKRSIIDLCLTNNPDSVTDLKIEHTPFGVNCQTCHKALTATIRIKPFERVPTSVTRRITYGRITRKKQKKVISQVTNQLVALSNTGELIIHS